MDRNKKSDRRTLPCGRVINLTLVESLYKKGHTLNYISTKVGFSIPVIRRYIVNKPWFKGIERSKGNRPKKDKLNTKVLKKIKVQYKHGKSLSRICRDLKLNYWHTWSRVTEEKWFNRKYTGNYGTYDDRIKVSKNLKRIKAYREKGLSIEKISEELNLSFYRVEEIVKEKGWKKKELVLPLRKIQKLYVQQNKSLKYIAEKYGVSYDRMYKQVKDKKWYKKNKSKHSLSNPEKTKIIKDYIKVKDIPKLSKKYKLTENQVMWILKAANVYYSKYDRAKDKDTNKYVECRDLTAWVWRNYGHTICKRKRKLGKFYYHIDHKFSLTDCCINNNVSVYEVCHPCNLQTLWWLDNIRKGAKSSIKLTDLRQKIKSYNKRHGDPFLDSRSYVVKRNPYILRRGRYESIKG